MWLKGTKRQAHCLSCEQVEVWFPGPRKGKMDAQALVTGERGIRERKLKERSLMKTGCGFGPWVEGAEALGLSKRGLGK